MATVVLAGIAAAASAAAAAGTGLFFATLFSVTGLTAFAVGAGLSLISRALAPKLNLSAQMGGRSVMTREAAHSRKIVYGRARIGGNVVYLESSGTDNKYLYLVTAIAAHEIDAYEQVWFNDEKVWDGGNFTSAWATTGNSSTSPYVDLSFHLGNQTTADSGLVAASSKWTANHKLLDTAYMVVKLTHDVDKFAQGLPNISTVIRGKKVLDPSNNSTAWSQNPALCIYDYLRDTKYGLGESAANILTSSVTTAKDVCDEAVSLAAGGAQPRYTIDGVVDTASSIKSNIETMTGSMIGRLIYSGGKFEIHAGEYVAPTITIDESMAVGEITVQTKQSRRNAFNGVKGVFVSEDDNYVVADYPAQQSKTTAGNFEVTSPPSVRYKILEIGSTDFTLIGAASNTVGLDFTATGAGTGDGVASLFLAQDGEPIYLDMALPFTINNIRAQRIAKLALLRSRQQEAITIPCNLTALKFKIGDNISVTNTRLGYSGKVFEVVGYSMGFNADQMVVNVEAIETAASIWNWQTSDEEVFLGGGEVDLYDGKVAIAPASVTVTGDSFLTADGAFSTAFKVVFPDANDAFTDHYVVEHKLASASSYFSQATKSSPFTIIGLQNGQQYNVRVKAVNEIGVSSAYVSATPTAATDTTAPSLPTSITATAGYKSISLAWTNPSQKDFDHVEIHRSTTSNGTYVQVSVAKGGFGAKSEHLDGGLADLTQFYYKFKSVDRSDNKTSDSDFNNQTPVNATTNAQVVDFPELNIALANTGGNVTTIDGGLITTDTISVNKLTGDVTELYPIAQQFWASNGSEIFLTTTNTTYATFSIPAPQLGILKRQKLDINIFFLIQNTGQSPVNFTDIELQIQKKSKGVNAVQVTDTNNKVTVESESIPFNQLISLSGNNLDKLDVSGGIAKTSTASGSYEPGEIKSLYYDATANKTYILVSAFQDIFSTNDDLYFSDSKFTSAGSWINPTVLPHEFFVNTPLDATASYVTQATIGSNVNKGKSSIVIPFKMSYGQTTTATDYRLQAKVENPQSGVTYEMTRMLGTMENVS